MNRERRQDIDHDCTDEIVCPWCGHEHTDSWAKSEGRNECDACEKPFILIVHTQISYTTVKRQA